MGFIVKEVEKNSIAEELGIISGDEIIDFNNQPFIDIIDYAFFMSKKRFSVGYIDKNGDPIKAIITKEQSEDLGVVFKKELLGRSRYCGNKCTFCFVDQLPEGMRHSLYHKDEDWRHSFIYGNYVTLSFLSKKDLKRIKKRKISHLYVSVHVTNEAKRKEMLGRDHILPIKPLMRKLARYGVEMHTQIVMLNGVNDGDYLAESYAFLKSLYPKVKSVSVIPVGLTGHRQGLAPLQDVTKEQACQVIDTVNAWQKKCRKQFGTGFVYVSDEMYLKAQRALPDADYYDGYPQIENGVGLITKFDDEFNVALDHTVKAKPKYKKCTIVTGAAFYPYIKKYAKIINQKYGTKINTIKAQNAFFGGEVNVAGLLTASDVKRAVKGKDIGEALCLSANMLRDGQDVFLDDVSIEDLRKQLGYKIIEISALGESFLKAFIV